MPRIACLPLLCAIPLLHAAPLARPYTVENYDVAIQIDTAKQQLTGEASIRFHSLVGEPISALEFDGGKLDISSVTEGPLPQAIERDHNLLLVVLTRPLRPDESRTITVHYQAHGGPGLTFSSDQVCAFAPGGWLPSNDRPGERATLHLKITAPGTTKIAASGKETGSGEWQIDQPTEPSLFGFAAGNFSEETSDADGIKLRVLGGGKPFLDATTAILGDFTEPTGKRYPAQTYTEVFGHFDAPHTLAGLTLLPDSFSANDIGPLADAVAHQWFGVAIEPKDWRDLWLSDGLAGFLAVSYVGKQSGKPAFDAAIARSRELYKQIAAEGKDHPLANIEWTSREDNESGLARNKGVLFLYQANQLMGDGAFWGGIRAFIGAHWNQTASTEDLQAALDAANGNKGRNRKTGLTPLDNLFDQWVYGILNPKR